MSQQGKRATDHSNPSDRPILVVTMGLPASGKTSLARELAQSLGMVHLSSDAIRKELAGLQPTDRRRDAYATGLYAASMSRWTYGELRRRAERLLRGGRSVVLDATFGRVDEREAVSRLAARTGAQLVILLCQADETTIRGRLAARVHDPGSVSDARPELWEALRSAFTRPDEIRDVIPIDTTKPLAEAVLEAVAAIPGTSNECPRRSGRASR